MLFVTPPWGTKKSKQYQSSTVTTPPHLNNHRDFNDLLMCKLPPTPLLNQELNVQKGKFIIKLNMIFKEVNCQWTTIFFALASKLLTLPAWSLELLMVSLIWINYFWSWSRQLVCQLIFFPCGRAGDSCESLEHHWEVISLLGNDFVNFVCLPLLLPIHSMATQAKIFMMGKNRDFTPRSLFKAKQSTGTAQAQAKQHLNRERYEKPQGCVRIQPLLFTRKIFVAWIAEGGRYFMGENSKNFLRWRSQIYRELRSHQKESKQYYSCKNRTRHRPVVEVIVGLFFVKMPDVCRSMNCEMVEHIPEIALKKVRAIKKCT